MGILERKKRERKEMRARIIETAMNLFVEEGFEKTSIRKIAERIEYSPATIYLYFPDGKDEIFHAVHEMAFEKFFEAMLAAIQNIEHPVEKLQAMGDEYLKFAIENPVHYELMFILDAPMKTHHTENEWKEGLNSFALLRYIVTECVEKGYFKKGDIESYCLLIFSAMHGMTSLAIRDRLVMFPEDQVEEKMNLGCDLMMKLLQPDN